MHFELTLTGQENALDVLNMMLGRLDDMEPAMRDIAFFGESNIRYCFATETGPDGTPWPESRRKQVMGGKTLTLSERLSDSATSEFDKKSARWGVFAPPYDRVHQGRPDGSPTVIKPKAAKALRFKLAETDDKGDDIWVIVKSVTIPARPYIPRTLAEADPDSLLDILIAHLEG